MQCPSCGATVAPEQKFCHECGASLRGITETTQEVAVVEPDVAAPSAAGVSAAEDAPDDSNPADDAAVAIDVADDSTTVIVEADDIGDAATDDIDDDAVEKVEEVEESQATDPVDGAVPLAAAAVATDLPSAADLPTAEINPRPPVPEPEWAVPPSDAATEPLAVTAAAAAATTATEELGAMPQGPPTAQSSTTEQLPAVFDGIEDVEEYPQAREPFKLRLTFVLAVLGAIATLMAAVADLTDIRTSRPVGGITNGTSTLDDIGSNLAIAGWVGTGVMVIGGLLACFGLRVGAGLAGGGGLAVLGWAALCIGLVEQPIAGAESITRESSELFTLTVTRDTGYWLIAAIGIVGLLVFLASLRLVGTGGQPPLNPWSAAVGALGMMMLAAGPLVPVGEASFSDNFSSPTPTIDLPTAYFAGRLAQLVLLAVTGVVGFLAVRRYGLGAAAGSIGVAIWLWLSSLLELGTDPVGLADQNPGATDTMPHGVTTAGMAVALLALAVTGVLAIIGRRPAGQPPTTPPT